MKKLILTFICLSTLISCASDTQTKERNFELTYNTTLKDIPEDSGVLRLWIPLPSNNDFQEIDDLTVNTEPPIKWTINTEEKTGNRMLFANLMRPPQNLKVDITLKVNRKENSSPHSQNPQLDPSIALAANHLIPIDQTTKEIAEKHTGNSQNLEGKAKSLVRHTLDHMQYDKSGSGWGHGDFQYACDVGRGNCTDFHAYFIGLSRSLGIPAYFEIGLPLNPQRGEGKTGKYHCWAYYQIDGTWFPVDISEADKDPSQAEYFSQNHCENRVAFSIGRDIVLTPPQRGEPLNYFIDPYVEIDGKKFDHVERMSYFKDL